MSVCLTGLFGVCLCLSVSVSFCASFVCAIFGQTPSVLCLCAASLLFWSAFFVLDVSLNICFGQSFSGFGQSVLSLGQAIFSFGQPSLCFEYPRLVSAQTVF